MLPTRNPRARRVLAVLAAASVLAVPGAAVLTGDAPAAAAALACGALIDGAHVVTTASELVAIGTGTFGGDCGADRTYRIANDIDVPARGSAVVQGMFVGALHGDDHTVTLAIDRTVDDAMDVGLFEWLHDADVSGLRLEGQVRAVRGGGVGALAGRSTGGTRITGVTSLVDVAGREDVGGLVGAAAGGTVSFSAVQVGTAADAVELQGVARVGGIVGGASSGVSITGPTTVHVRSLPRSDEHLAASSHGGLIGFALGEVIVDGSGTGAAHGVAVGFALLVPDGPATRMVGGVAGGLIVSDVVLRGLSVELDVLTGGDTTGGLVGSLRADGAATIGGPGADDAVLVTGAIVGGDATDDGAAGVTPTLELGSVTSIRGLTMAAAVAGSEVGGVAASVNGTLTIASSTVSGPIEGTLTAGGIASSVSFASLTLRDALVASDLRADIVGGIAADASRLDLDLDGVELTGTLRPRAATSDGFRSVGAMFASLSEVTFTGPVDLRAVDATIVFDFPAGLAVSGASINVAGLVPFLGSTVDVVALSEDAASAPTLAVTVSDALRAAGRCWVATRYIRSGGPGGRERVAPPSPDPCAGTGGGAGGGGEDGGADGGAGRDVAARVDGPDLACTWSRLAVGARVACTASGGPADAPIAWRALVNPTVASGAVVLDGSGTGAFAFTIPAAALGGQLAVELIEWRPPVLLGTVVGALPSGVPAGSGPVPARGAVPGVLLLVALAGLATALRPPVSGRPSGTSRVTSRVTSGAR
jgi:hypothetical protein